MDAGFNKLDNKMDEKIDATKLGLKDDIERNKRNVLLRLRTTLRK